MYRIGKLTEKTFYEVKELQRIFSTSFEASIKRPLTCARSATQTYLIFFAHYNYIRKEIEEVNERECCCLMIQQQRRRLPALKAFFGKVWLLRSDTQHREAVRLDARST